jgi:hypothetical protein
VNPPAASTHVPDERDTPRHDGAGTSRLDEISWPVRTERLSLRPAVVADVDATCDQRIGSVVQG